MPDAAGPACASHVMNSPSCSAPACQSFPVRAHHRRNSAIAPAYALVVDSAPSRPNRRCRKNASANGTTDSSSSSTVQYPAPDGNLTMNARTRDPPILVTDCEQLPATSTAPTEDGSKTTLRVAFPHIMHQVKRPLEKPPNGASTPWTPSPGYSPTAPGSRPQPRPHSTAAGRRPRPRAPAGERPPRQRAISRVRNKGPTQAE